MRNKQYFLDSNILIALLDAKDVHHKKATKIYTKIQSENGELFLSDIVINEVLSVFAKRCEQKRKSDQFKIFANKFQSAIKTIPILCLYELLPQNYKSVITLMKKHNGLLNFHDALISVFLSEIPKVVLVTFDRDFSMIPSLSTLPPTPH